MCQNSAQSRVLQLTSAYSSFANQFKAFGAAARTQHSVPRIGSQKLNSGSGQAKSNKSKNSQFFSSSHAKWGLAVWLVLGLMTAQAQAESTDEIKYEDFFGPRRLKNSVCIL